ncbi:MAG: acyl-CoA thioesterase II [Bacteroidota bacterium]
MQSAAELLQQISLEKIEENIFRGQSHSIGGRRVFGGQVLAQSLQAAMLTAPEDRLVHSMHGYFVLAGDTERPIIYDVDRVRDGGSFTTRRVRAIQHGQPIFTMAASFQKMEEGNDHQIEMPKVPPPEEVLSDQELANKLDDQLPSGIKNWLFFPRPIEFRPVEGPTMLDRRKHEPFHHVWFRAKGELGDDPRDHQVVLAYASDYNLLSTALKPHSHIITELMMASLDHAMWFHRSFRADDWLLYALDSPSASNARGFTRGNVFDRSGKLVASVVQEGLIRIRK